jgi:hypothetical protein
MHAYMQALPYHSMLGVPYGIGEKQMIGSKMGNKGCHTVDRKKKAKLP